MTSLERTQNLLANHRIPIQKSTDLSSLSLASRKLARSHQLTQQEEHTAQLFFAQRGYDLSRHLHSVLSTRVEPRPHRVIPTIDFDLDQHVSTQQEVLAANLLQSSLAHHHIAATDVFSTALCNDWQSSKNSILQSMSYTVGLPTPNDPANEKWATSNNFANPLLIPDSAANQFTTTQDYYGQAISAFTRRMHESHTQRDLIGLREAILELPQHLTAISRDLEQCEISQPMSTSTGIDANGQPLQIEQLDNSKASLALLRQHEQCSEFWLWFDCLSQVLVVEHSREEQLKQEQQQQQQQQQQQGGFDDEDYRDSASNFAQNSQQKVHYRYKNWFLPTSSSHGVVATIEYLQQCFIEYMSNTIAQDHELSALYNECIETVADDNILMLELITLFTRSREFRTRFIVNSHSTDAYNNQIVSLGVTNPNSMMQSSPNLDISPSNPWSILYACIRSGYYSAAVAFLSDSTRLNDSSAMNFPVLLQVLKLYAEHQEVSPITELQLPADLWSQLYREMNTLSPITAGSKTNTNTGSPIFQDSSQTGNPFRKVVYSTLGHFPLLAQEMKGIVTPYVLTTIEDFLWYRLKLVTQQVLPNSLIDSYRILSQTSSSLNNSMSMQGSASTGLGSTSAGDNNNANLLDQLSLANLQTSILTRGKAYFTGVGGGGFSAANTGSGGVNVAGGLLYVHMLFMTQQFERAIVEFFTINPVLAFHLALMCLVYGLIRTTDMHSELCIPIHLGVKSLQTLQSVTNGSVGNSAQSTLTSPSQLGYTVMDVTLHTRFAINMYKVVAGYVQTIQSHRVDQAVAYCYTSRFIPLFGNISLYSSYINNNSSISTQQQLDLTLNTISAPAPVHSQHQAGDKHNLISLEYSINMVFNTSIPKNLLHLYQTTVLNLNSPISNLILTHDKVTMTPLQYQQYFLQKQHKELQGGAGAHHTSNNQFAINASNDQMFLDSTLGGGNANMTALFGTISGSTGGGNDANFALAHSCGVELPLLIDLLLLNKLDAGILLGFQRTLESVAEGGNNPLDPTGQNNGTLGDFYPPTAIFAMAQLAAAREFEQ